MSQPSNKKRVILLANADKARACQAGQQLRRWLTDRAQIVADNCDGTSLDLGNLPAADFIIVLGGDGTILSTVRHLSGHQVPLIGVNIGKLGFLAEFSLAQLKEQFDQITSNPALISRRILLNCHITGPDRTEFVSPVVNEVAVIAGPPFRMIEVSVSVADEHLAICAGDGLVVATPTGSTAYNLSAGGPILAADLTAAVINPLAAHSLSFRPIVVATDKPIILRCTGRFGPSGATHTTPGQGLAVVAIDGQDNTPLNSGDQVVITRDSQIFQLVQNPQHGQWRLLNTKLNWGALPNYDQTEHNE